jgi:hypothetical protein
VFAAALLAGVALWQAAPPAAAKRADPGLARVEAARGAFAAVRARYAAGIDSAEAVYAWSVRWLKSQRPLSADKAAAFRDHLDRMKALEQAAGKRVETGLASPAEKHGTAYYVAEAEAWAAQGATD